LINIIIVSLMACLTAIFTLLIKKMFGNKLSPKFHYYIWIVFILRLIFPFTPESNISIFNLPVEIYSRMTTSVNAKEDQFIPDNYYFENDYINNNQPVIEMSMSEYEPSPEPVSEDVINTDDNLPRINITDALFYLYLTGTLLCLISYITNYLKFKNKLYNTITYACDEDQKLFEDIKYTLNVTRYIKLYKGKESMLIGVLSPIIILADDADENDKRIIITHELLHYKNKDNIINVALSIIKSIYWFNPLIAYFIGKIKNDMEILCDTKSIDTLNCGKIEYSMMLFNHSNRNDIKKAPSAVMRMSAKGKELKHRIKHISVLQKSSVKASFTAAVLVIMLIMTTLTNPLSVISAEIYNSASDMPVDEVKGDNKLSAIELMEKCTPDLYNHIHFLTEIADVIEYEYFTVDEFKEVMEQVLNDSFIYNYIGYNYYEIADVYENMINDTLIRIENGEQIISGVKLDMFDENGESLFVYESDGRMALQLDTFTYSITYDSYDYAQLKNDNSNNRNWLSGFNYFTQLSLIDETDNVEYYTPEQYRKWIEIYKRLNEIKRYNPASYANRILSAMENELKLIEEGIIKKVYTINDLTLPFFYSESITVDESDGYKLHITGYPDEYVTEYLKHFSILSIDEYLRYINPIQVYEKVMESPEGCAPVFAGCGGYIADMGYNEYDRLYISIRQKDSPENMTHNGFDILADELSIGDNIKIGDVVGWYYIN